jgi:pilus assembly protein CpaE
VVKPAAPAELLARIRSMARLEETARGHVVAVWGSKGGVGSSVLASNLAVALRSLDGGEVTLVDASVLGGSIGVCLNIISPHSIADLMPRFESLDTDLLDSVLANHSSGIRVLLSAPWGQDGASPLEPLQVERILGRLRQSSAYVVVDTSPSLDPTTVGVLRQADQTVVVLTPEMTALRNVRVALRVFKSWGQDPRRLIMVLNSCAAKGGILLRDVESALEAKMDVLVPSDEPMVMYSINRGIPLVSSHPKSAVGQGMLRLAQVVASRTQGQAQRLG